MERKTPDLRVVSSGPTEGIQITFFKNEKKKRRHKNLEITGVGGDVGKLEPLCTVVRTKNGAAPMENNVFLKIVKRITI